MRAAALVFLLTLPGAALAQAEPCVGANFDRPLPGASAVERRFADVPTARYPGIWQEGRVAGHVYQLSSDITGLLAPTREAPEWQVAVLCDPGAGTCEQQRSGEVPSAALPVAEALGRCLLGEAVSAADFGPDPAATLQGLPPEAGVTGEARLFDSGAGLATAAGALGARRANVPGVPDAADAGDGADRPAAIETGQGGQSAATADEEFESQLRPAEACGLDGIGPGVPPVRTLQRLLEAEGFDPGPIDGLMGARTREALVAALGPEAAQLSPQAAVTALDSAFCED
ncbi:peptidoglycan-binding domain-containing protein [Allosediminivita pacifica]|uniref:Peptidoglycan binding-like domain-containing protein n=1 Tax=Allosediminivita pacifica TaxID=1267769 RepID=A0A2T6B3R8_9RHOB|nr:peptidoglycan-binding domain-containing protein [Allosediminivita pacifica]PTX50728.1 hypothetical protein C8N44_10483 [Allosediminivita pacifica]GGB00724.1 hypothetical protein GCM10011324_08740 [Allosediminivita pacifica]